ncbi:MAG TPA: DUF302 domain-containing protein [Bacteroidales bacterium]|nr:DUF302 domain-containing protein [Bacteroidales bacterium]
MSYYFNKTVRGKSFDEVTEMVKSELSTEGFGVITEIDLKEAFKMKINIDFRNYKILGACNPHFAYKALEVENKIGVFLPCNVVIDELEPGVIEVSAVDPIASMISVKNESLGSTATGIQQKLRNVIDRLV